jgi:O-antigen/teichoic acid export membrane protein
MLRNIIDRRKLIDIDKFKQNYPVYSRLLGEGFWGLTGKIIVMMLSVLMNSMLARLFSPDDMGDFIFILSLVSSGVVVAKMGLGPTSVRMVAAGLGLQAWGKVRQSIIDITKFGISSGLLIFLVFGIIGGLLGIARELVWVVALLIMVLAYQELVSNFLRGFHDIRSVVFLKGARIGGIITYVIVILYLLFVLIFGDHISVNKIIVSIICAGVTSIIWGSRVLRKYIIHLGNEGVISSSPLNLKILTDSIPILASTILALIISQSSIWLLKYFLPSSEIAIYGIASQVVTMASIQFGIISFVLSPTVAELYAQGKKNKLEKLQRRVATLGSSITLVFILIIILAGKDLLGFIYGDFYRASFPMLIILSVGYFIQVLTGSSGSVLLMSGNQNIMLKISLISSLFTVVLAWFLIIQFGSIGASIGTTVGIITSELLMLFSVRKKLGIWTHFTFRVFRFKLKI